MLQQVVIEAATPKTFQIDAVDPDDTLIVTSISGLDPADVTLFTGEFARAGGYYQGRRTGQRNVVINLKINPDYASDIEVSDLREELYSLFFEPFATSDGVPMRFVDDRKPDRRLVGYAEKMPSDLFSRDTKAQVSLICVDPFLLSVNPVVGNDAVGWATLPLTYDGTARRGLNMTILVKTATASVNVDINGVKMTLTKTTGNFAVNDVITISTVDGFRFIRQNGTDIMALLTASSKWLQLAKGVNTVKVYGTAEADGKA
ncbi:MAG TPA: hypothetical protein VFT30_06430, partial [Nitrospira sp.]|nr:hypothetical protein [Nitrospira sp.]